MGLFDSIANIATGGAYGVTKAVVTSKPVAAVTKQVGTFVKDSVKLSVAGAVMPWNSVTGHRYNPKLESGIGKTAGGLALAGAANINILAKTFADTITGGYASKFANNFRAKNNQERLGHYAEMGLGAGNGNDFVDKVIGLENKASVVLGKFYGSKYGLNASPEKAIVQTGTVAAQALKNSFGFLHAPSIVLGSKVLKAASPPASGGDNPGTQSVGTPLKPIG